MDAVSSPDAPTGLDALVDLLSGRRVVVLSGAGCSTESGIPDYRGPEGRPRAKEPMRYQEFVGRPEARRRYWAGSSVGWPRIARARPNDAHRALARLEERGVVRGVITQNVDGLHQAAGSRRVVELHGALARVLCLACGERSPRDRVQARLAELNPGWPDVGAGGSPAGAAARAPDGDARVAADAAEAFRVPDCDACGGTLKPDVVFFGENVPRPVVDAAWALLDEAEVLLVVGSSLTVYSGRRFVDRAAKEGVPVAIVNRGVTRGDDRAAVRIDGAVGRVLPRLAGDLLDRGDG